jgi:hypothetical protein
MVAAKVIPAYFLPPQSEKRIGGVCMKKSRIPTVFRNGHLIQKLVAVFLVLPLFFSMVTVGFAQERKLLFAAGGIAATFYPLGGAISKVWNQKIPGLNVTVQTTGGSVENARLIGRGDSEMGLCMSDVAYYGRNGLEVFSAKNEKYTGYSAVANVYPDVIQIFVNKDSPMQSIYDFKGKKISVGPPGGGTEISARQIFSLHGLDYRARKDLTPMFLSYAEAAEHFKDKLLDGCFFVVAPPNAALQDINSVRPVKFFNIDDQTYKKISEAFPFFIRFEIPANTYQGQTSPIKTVAIMSILLVRNELPEDLVYQMTKLMFEEKATIAQGHSAGRFINLETAATGIAIPFHPGAQKYLKEKGVLK